VLQSTDNAGLARETRDEGRIARQRIQQHFDRRDEALLDVGGAVDNTHRAATNFGFEQIGSQPLPNE
jgi:hypothetical protein